MFGLLDTIQALFIWDTLTDLLKASRSCLLLICGLGMQVCATETNQLHCIIVIFVLQY